MARLVSAKQTPWGVTQAPESLFLGRPSKPYLVPLNGERASLCSDSGRNRRFVSLVDYGDSDIVPTKNSRLDCRA
jgi:hypothetical protein